ncbi:MAG: hypothetical protein C4521_05985 [Actinobacteria bacterium]|nr:MAG: hypothetical protein C4521_05985 [Actinomycetota bacterium]
MTTPLGRKATFFVAGLLCALLLAFAGVSSAVDATTSTARQEPPSQATSLTGEAAAPALTFDPELPFEAGVDATLVAQSSATTITATQPVTITAYTTPALTNLAVYLQASRNGRTFGKVGRMPYSSGMRRYWMRVKPASNTYYRVVWARPGASSKVTPAFRIYVRPRLRLYLSSYTVPWGRKTTIFGNVYPSHAGKYVEIHIKSGSTWRLMYKLRLNKYSKYAVVFKPRLKGYYPIRAYFGPEWDHPANSTGTRTIRVVQGAVNPEGRGVWVTRWSYRGTKAGGTEDIYRIMRNASEANMNIVYFQVRGTADAYYKSNYEPWAKRLSGTLGKDPGWDPLQTAIDAARRNGIKLHAWINAFTMWSGTTAPPVTSPLHIYYNPGWKVASRYKRDGKWYFPDQRLNSSYIWASPGNSAVRNHIRNVIVDLVSNYEVDGVHLDRIRYPGPQYSWDYASREAYGRANAAYGAAHNGATLPRSVWQRRQVSAMVSSVYQGVKETNPEVQVSAAAWGIYTNRWKWPGVSDGLRDYYQDSQSWTAAGVVDFLAPMTFWDLDHIPRWSTLVSDFVSHRSGRQIYPGIAAYMYRSNFNEIRREIAAGRNLGAAGFSFFDYTTLSGRWTSLAGSFPLMVDPPRRGAETDISLESTTTTPSLGETIALQGTVLAEHEGKTVRITMYEGTRWAQVASGTLDRWSRYETAFTVPRSGSLRLRAVFAGDADHAGSVSRELVLNVP